MGRKGGEELRQSTKSTHMGISEWVFYMRQVPESAGRCYPWSAGQICHHHETQSVRTSSYSHSPNPITYDSETPCTCEGRHWSTFILGVSSSSPLQEEFSGDSHLEEHLAKALRGWCTQNHATVSVSKPAWPLPWRVVLGGGEGSFLFPAFWFLPEVWLQRHRAHPWSSTVPSVLACPSAGRKLQTTDGFSLENLFSSRLTPPNPRDPSISWSN